MMAKKPTYEELKQMVKELKEEVDKNKRAVETLHASEQNRKLEAQLKQTQKIQDLGTLANDIIHDLNNSLQSIFSYTQLLLLEKQSDDPDFEKLKEIKKAAQKASEIIHRFPPLPSPT